MPTATGAAEWCYRGPQSGCAQFQEFSARCCTQGLAADSSASATHWHGTQVKFELNEQLAEEREARDTRHKQLQHVLASRVQLGNLHAHQQQVIQLMLK